MARSKNSNKSCFSFSSQIFHSLSKSPSTVVVITPKKHCKQTHHNLCNNSLVFSLIFVSLLIFLIFLALFKLSLDRTLSQSLTYSSFYSSPVSPLFFVSSKIFAKQSQISSEFDSMVPLPARKIDGNLTEQEREFWRQPDGLEFQPCLDFSVEYRRKSAKITKEKKRFLMVVVSGGLNQQRKEIVDAVIIARILEAALVLPILQVNVVWEDESEFSEVFDAEHFKRSLQSDVRIVSSLPSTHLMLRPSVQRRMPINVSPLWIRAKFFDLLKKEGVLLLKGLDSRLSRNLPLDLQRLRCKVAFQALRFATPISQLGYRLAQRMWSKGPYIALHLRLEKDVWVRTGCLPGLGPEYNDMIANEREYRQEFLTGRLNMSYHCRKIAGLCPLNAREVARILRAMGAPRSARVYCAGGEPFGGDQALQPLMAEFPHLYKKQTLALGRELAPFANRLSALAAIDYIVSLSSDVFMPSHGGNMGRFMKGHRAYAGHRKFITPNKRAMLPYLSETSNSGEDFDSAMKRVHRVLIGQPELRTNKNGREVIAFPVPECMCQRRHSGIF